MSEEAGKVNTIEDMVLAFRAGGEKMFVQPFISFFSGKNKAVMLH